MATSKRIFKISELVSGVYETHSYAAAQKGLRFTYSISHKLPLAVIGDPESIRQALLVITNMAIEDTSSGSVELNVDLQKMQNDAFIVKFSVVESLKQNPYWFSVSLESAKSIKTA